MHLFIRRVIIALAAPAAYSRYEKMHSNPVVYMLFFTRSNAFNHLIVKEMYINRHQNSMRYNCQRDIIQDKWPQ
jgi:hypothetical protein